MAESESKTPSSPQSQKPQPVAYDTEGRPLYYHPPTTDEELTPGEKESRDSLKSQVGSHVSNAQPEHEGHNFDPRMRTQYSNEPSVVHATREVEPEPFQLSEEVRSKHEQSKKRYPFLNLSEGEYVIVNIQRHPIGLLTPIAASGMVIFILLAILIAYPADGVAGLPGFGLIAIPIILLMIVMSIGAYIAVWIYQQNQFFMTNESVVQEIQHGLFSRHEQTVSLGSVEDVSFVKKGIIQSLFDYGMIRLSTEGEETTYRFNYVANPKKQTAILNNAVEAFKNGRPVTDKIANDYLKQQK